MAAQAGTRALDGCSNMQALREDPHTANFEYGGEEWALTARHMTTLGQDGGAMTGAGIDCAPSVEKFKGGLANGIILD